MSKKDSIATVDRDVPDFIELPPDVAGAWRMDAVDPVAELRKFEAAAELQSKLLPASIKRTLPGDWIAHGEAAYLQATGVERLAPLWGLWFGNYTVEKENNDDGSFSYAVVGPVLSRRTGVLYARVIGGRSSADPFFDDFDEARPIDWNTITAAERAVWKRAHRIPPDPLEVRKAAVTNWSTRGGSMLMGMRGLTVAYLASLGIAGVRRVEYGAGAKGGETTPAELKADRVKLGNEVLAAAGGDREAARKLLKEITSGKDFGGFDSIEGLKQQWQIDNARARLEVHPVFGKKPMREPGDES